MRGENITRKEDTAVTRARLAEIPDIVVATPSRAMQWVNEEVLQLGQIKQVVADEADLLLSYDYEDDLRSLAAALPEGVQTIMMSATLQTSTSTLTELLCGSKKDPPTILDLSAEEAASAEKNALAQYLVRTSEEDKFLLLYAMLKLKLVTGKIIVFVADVDRAYRVKLFLEQFGIRSCVLNGELPINSRMHVVEEFTRGVYDILITADEIEVAQKDGKRKKRKVQEAEQDGEIDGIHDGKGEAEQDQEGDIDDDRQENGSEGQEKSSRKHDGREDGAEFTLSRGLDIRQLACVLNFDIPTTLQSYIHRIGRTARAGKTGMAVSFYVPKELYGKHRPTSIPQCANDEEVIRKIQKKYGSKDPADPSSSGIQEWHFEMAKLEGFRYRLASALRNVTRLAIREARTRELRNELINSAKLQRHFEENPEDLRHLRHDNETRTARRDPHLKHVPDYLLPAGGGKTVAGDVGFVSLRGDKEGRKRKGFERRRSAKKVRGGKGMDPLKSLNARGKAKK